MHLPRDYFPPSTLESHRTPAFNTVECSSESEPNSAVFNLLEHRKDGKNLTEEAPAADIPNILTTKYACLKNDDPLGSHLLVMLLACDCLTWKCR